MTNQKAIRLIRNLPTMCEFTDAYGEPIDSDAYYEAVDIAISALQAQELSETQKPLDTISRQAVIKAVDKFIPADPMKNDYTQGISVGLAIATRCIEEFSQETDESSQGLVKDLISKQAAIDALSVGKELLSRVLDDMDVVGADREKYSWGLGLIEAYIKDIEELPSAQPELQWIPCSERLPDVAQRVLLSGHGTVMVGMLHSFGKYSLEPTGISYVYQKDDIDAWMPLPEPYRAERRTDEQNR